MLIIIIEKKGFRITADSKLTHFLVLKNVKSRKGFYYVKENEYPDNEIYNVTVFIMKCQYNSSI